MADIHRWKVVRDTDRPAPIVHGVIAIEGDFTWQEWVALENMLLSAKRRPIKRPPALPSKHEIVGMISSGADPGRLADGLTSHLEGTPKNNPFEFYFDLYNNDPNFRAFVERLIYDAINLEKR